ncbi:MAG TPA: formate dehydrogenase accessory sulfurtransferase FdhD, partial [Methylomirabilota bacterium]
MSQEPEIRATEGVTAVKHPIVRVRQDDGAGADDHVAVEEPLEIRLGGHSLAVTMRTPGDDEELIAGFLHSERVIRSADDLDVLAPYRAGDGEPGAGNVVNVLLKGNMEAARERLRRNFVTASSCGLCGKVTIEAIQADLPPVTADLVLPAAIFSSLERAMGRAQPTFERTGGLHAAGLFDADGRLLVLREDIGRHNAVDKVVGHMLLARRLPLDRHILMVSGRASFEIMQKALAARIPVVAAVSAPSSMAVEMAVAADMTLV